VAVNGCCDTLTSHRGAVMAVNGVQRTPERFAIDWLQLRPDDRLYSGDRGKLESYAYFGAPVYAVADGTVVNLYDKATEQVPGEAVKGITTENIGGNMLVIDIGGGNFAFFAHLKPGSLRVKLGDRVKRGQVIALLGNTGNTDGPHLHFHVMDGKSPLDANGKPYVFRHFVGQGVLDDASAEAMFVDGKPGVIKPSPMDGKHNDELPLNDEIVDFGS
jgi:murein DD-endopeptidase MepM/ murein hydrolase activator NlpD